MRKKISGYINLVIPAGKANPSPPVGPALGQRGVNIMDFCKAFNDATKTHEPGTPIPVIISVYVDKSFSFELKMPPVSYFLKKMAKVGKGSGTTGKSAPVAKVSVGQLREIAEKKIVDMNALDIDAAVRMIEGTALSMGIDVVE